MARKKPVTKKVEIPRGARRHTAQLTLPIYRALVKASAHLTLKLGEFVGQSQIIQDAVVSHLQRLAESDPAMRPVYDELADAIASGAGDNE